MVEITIPPLTLKNCINYICLVIFAVCMAIYNYYYYKTQWELFINWLDTGSIHGNLTEPQPCICPPVNPQPDPVPALDHQHEEH
uniref:Transmembrane protein n=1 Tax=Panagrellus redivivus TaxID=6233 RepID=A0A7E4ZYD6_PANRE